MNSSVPLAGYIDLHAHILPGLDDGASSMQMALNMARMAVADGIVAMVATPHLNPASNWNNGAEIVSRSVDVLRRHLHEAQIPLTIYGAAEVRLNAHTQKQLQTGFAPLLTQHNAKGKCRYVLTEFAHAGLQGGELYMCELLVHKGYTPVIAHPERIRTFRHDPSRLEPFMALGCKTQVTCSSVCGSYGEKTAAVIDTWIEQGWVQVLATDTHDIHHRQPAMRDAVRLVAQQFGVDKATQMVMTNPQRILDGQALA
ncbi:tyrosine-protein phosphatase [Magnetococcus sp. PR-3]|uniref:tyrosine-protein phosphatase n=1 Tax=Magnetococcus sp. PR-3 TaxID=3120355 RepID=UPI002FCE1E26